MPNIALGYVASPLTVNLTADADFIQTLTTADSSDWPDGTVISLVFGDPAATTWTATLSGSSASWNVDKADVNTLKAATSGSRLSARVTYSDGAGVDLTWMSGVVSWHG